MSGNTAGESAPPADRMLVFGTVMLATIMTALDTTIANVALPHMAGSVSASQDQIAWVLTSYIVASAICTPITGWLSDRFGRKRLFLIAIAGFTLASALCGAAQSLAEIVAFRVLQGVFAAPLGPLSQTLVLDLFSVAERGPAMAFWGIGVMVAPIAGPVLGGWLTDQWSWRWVFYINLPIGILCLLGISAFIPSSAPDRSRPFDLLGFAFLSIAIAAMQLVFDRGQGQGWFDAPEIILEAAVAFLALWFSLVHSFTSARPFLPLGVFKDVNFATSSVLGILVGVVVLSVSALLPSMLQGVYGYSVLDAGMLTAPRGLGSILSMLMVGRLIGRTNTRALLIAGLAVYAFSFYNLSTFTLDTSATAVSVNGFIQGLGTGFVFLPLTTMAFATITPAVRGDATAFYALVRSLGGSVGISLMLAMLTNSTVSARGQLSVPYSPENAMISSGLPPPLSLNDPTGIVLLSAQVDRQSAMLGYSQVFHTMFLVTLVAIPLVLMMRTTRQPTLGSTEAAYE